MVMLNIFFIVGTILFASANGESCVPRSVTNVGLSLERVLTWVVRDDEICNITYFSVQMTRPAEGESYEFNTTTTSLSVDFLGACDAWYFNIIPYADTTRGAGHTYIARIPVPIDADLSLGEFEIVHDPDTDVVELNWDLESVEYGNCSIRYRVTVSGDNENVIHDTYTSSRSIKLTNLLPCVAYELGIRAVNYAPPILEGPLKSVYYDFPGEVQSPPTLQTVNLGATEVNLTFGLEHVNKNRCPVREFYVNGGAYLNVSVPIDDTDERRTVDVQLSGLKPKSMYLLRASVQNSAGWSNPTIFAVQTLEFAPSKEEEEVN